MRIYTMYIPEYILTRVYHKTYKKINFTAHGKLLRTDAVY